MTFLAAPIWNQIARSQTLETEAAKVAFQLDGDQLAKQDDLWMKAEAAAGTPDKVARCLPVCLPLLTESLAIQAYLQQNPQLKGAIPEILDAADAVDLMTADYHLNAQEQTSLESILSSPRKALARWLQVAHGARRAA
jgi:hypothetical protein